MIIATGSEIGIALEAADILAGKQIPVRVVSAPCVEIFLEQDRAYQDSVLPEELPRIAVEAGLRYGWDALIGREGGFVGMTGFGASAPAEALYEHFGITADSIVKEVLERV